MSRGRKVLVVVLALVGVAAVAGAWFLRPIAAVATGYPARVLCGAHFVTGRAVDDAAVDIPDNPLVPLVSYEADAEAGTMTSTFLRFYRTTAHHTPGLGCTLGDEAPDFVAPATTNTPDPSAPWPEGSQVDTAGPGVDVGVVQTAVDGAFAEDDPEGREKVTRAVAVVHDGRLIAERYADGLGPDSPIIGWSATKSVGNAIVGRLVHQGVLEVSQDALLPAWAEDDRSAITLDDLLRMQSGLDFDEVYDPGTDATVMLFTPRDASEFAAAKPLANEPGTEWYYSSGSSNVVCDIAHEASGLGPEMPDELVFAPLGMSSALIEPDASGDIICSSFMYATAQDWARFGQWFLQDGVWDGERLLPEDWVEYSTTPVELERETPYGAHWWLNEGPDGELRMPSVPADAYWASGFQGQQVVVIPSADLVVVRLGASKDFDGIDWGLEDLVAPIVEAVGGQP